MRGRIMMGLVALAALVSTLLVTRGAQAQSFSRLQPGERAVTLETGLQAGVSTSVGFATGLHLGGRTVTPFVQGTLLAARPNPGDFAVRAGAQTSVLHLGWFDLTAQLAVGVEGTENSIHRATALRASTVLLAGHYGRSWFALAEGGYDHAFATYIASTDYYRTSIYAEAKDGWYANTAGTFHAGLKGGVKIAAVELVLRAGVNRSEQLNELFLPFYVTLGASYLF